jgi:hypothetical protein
MNLDKEQRTRLAIALGAVVALVLGFSVLNKSDDGASTASAASQRTAPGMNGQAPPGAPGASSATGASGATGGMGRGPGGPGGPGGQAELTGATATKAKAAAVKAAGGTADHTFKNPSGSGYVVIVEKSDGTHVFVELDSNFKVTAKRTMQGPPGGVQGGQPPQWDGTQQGAAEPGTSAQQ